MANNSFSLFHNIRRYCAPAILVFFLIVMLVPASAHAATNGLFQCIPGQWGDLSWSDWASKCLTPAGQIQDLSVTALEYYTGNKGGDLTGFDIFKGVATYLYVGLSTIVFAISNLIFITSGWLLDKSLLLSFSPLFHLAAVTAGWSIVRDVANMFFIFIMLAISIATILRLEGYGVKNLLAKVIVVALLINFSLPISKTIIDLSNILALNFYNLLIPNPAADPSVSMQINKATHIQSTLDKKQDQLKQSITGNEEMVGTVFFGASAVMLVSSFVFLAFAAIFIIRNIYLAFLLIFAPLGYFGLILPYTQGHAKDWWGKLIHQSLIAPVGMMTLYIALTIAKEINIPLSGTAAFSSLFSGQIAVPGQDNTAIILNFALVIGILIGAVTITQKLGAVGSSTAINWGNSVYKGSKAFAGKHTYSRAAVAIDKQYGEKLRALSPTYGGWASRQLKGIGGEYSKYSQARVEGVSSIKDTNLRLEAMSKLNASEQTATWQKISQQQKAEMTLKSAGTPYEAMIRSYSEVEAKKKVAQAEARAGAAVTGEARRLELAKSYTEATKFKALDDKLSSIVTPTGALRTDVVQDLVKELSALGKDLTSVESVFKQVGNTQAAERLSGVSGVERALINAGLKSTKEPQVKGDSKPDATGAPKP